jgi:hypothetical protein
MYENISCHMHEIKSFTTEKFILHLHAEVQVSTINKPKPWPWLLMIEAET